MVDSLSQSQEAAVTHSQLHSSFLIKNRAGLSIEELVSHKSNYAFSSSAIDFLDLLSKQGFQLCRDSDFKHYSSFFFWIRRQNLKFLKSNYDSSLFGRGLSFHVSPANVPLNTLYSLVFGILSGSPTLVRVSDRVINQLLPFIELLDSIRSDFLSPPPFSLISYPQNHDINSELSSLAASRIIWGGNETVNYFKSLSTHPLCIDICFKNRSGLCIIDLQKLETLPPEHFDSVCQGLANDIALYSQQACSSPLFIIFVGPSSTNTSLKYKLFSSINAIIAARHSEFINQRTHFESAFNSVLKCSSNLLPHFNYSHLSVINIQLDDVNHLPLNHRPSFGTLFSYDATSLDQVYLPDDLQTVILAPYDSEFLHDFVTAHLPFTYNRIVRPGQAINMNLFWDGFDIIRLLTRSIELPTNAQ